MTDVYSASSFTAFTTDDAMPYSDSTQGYWKLYSEENYETWVNSLEEINNASGGLLSSITDYLTTLTDGYTIVGNLTYTRGDITDGGKVGLCISVENTAISCWAATPSLNGEVLSYSSYYSNLSTDTATAPATGVTVSTSYNLADSTYNALEHDFACTSTIGATIYDTNSCTCYLMQPRVPSSGNGNPADYRFDLSSGSDGTIKFWYHEDNLGNSVEPSEWKGAVSGIAAATGAIALALLSF